jgi:hypothetical protein
MKRALLLIAVAACGKGSGPTGSGAKDTVLDAWKKGGLEVGEMKPTTSDVGKDCSQGTVSKLDVLVCSFASTDEAKKAEELGLKWVGDTTGMSQAKGSLVIAVADRKKADPNGKTINQIFKLVPQ